MVGWCSAPTRAGDRMRVPLSWLRELVAFDLTPEQLAERLTLLGMEVKGIERRGTEWANVVVGELLAVEKHPRADRLSLTRVTTGSGEPLEIVCGATNIAVGQRVPVALPGAVLPGNRRIERTEKMGVVSNGMLCSGDELGLTADADGILILAPETPLGAKLADLYGDVVLDVDVKPNRGDALSIVGIAREVAAVAGGRVALPADGARRARPRDRGAAHRRRRGRGPVPAVRRSLDRGGGRSGRRRTGSRCGCSRPASGRSRTSSTPRTTSWWSLASRSIPSMPARWRATGRAGRASRSGSPGQGSGSRPSTTSTARSIRTRCSSPTRTGPLGIAGVMGGASSEVSDATRDVIVESAIFDPVSIRRTAFRYALRSEASLRFEKGQEFRLARLGADRATRLIAEWAGGTVASGAVDTHPERA